MNTRINIANGGEVNINGRVFHGAGQISIDGNGNITVNAQNGSYQRTMDGRTMPAIQIAIIGNVQSIQTASGNVGVKGSIGSVNTTSGDVSCDAIGGSANTTSGNIQASTIHGSANTVSGNIYGSGGSAAGYHYYEGDSLPF